MSNKSAFFAYGSGFTEEEYARLITFTLKEKARFNQLLENYGLHTLLEHRLLKEQGIKVAKFVVENEDIFDCFVTDHMDFADVMRPLSEKEQVEVVTSNLKDKARFDRIIRDSFAWHYVLQVNDISNAAKSEIIKIVFKDKERFKNYVRTFSDLAEVLGSLPEESFFNVSKIDVMDFVFQNCFDQFITDNRRLCSLLRLFSEAWQNKCTQFVFADSERVRRFFGSDVNEVDRFKREFPKLYPQLLEKLQSLEVSPLDDKKREAESSSSRGDQRVTSISTSRSGGPAAPSYASSFQAPSSRPTGSLPVQSDVHSPSVTRGSLDGASSSITTQTPGTVAPSDLSGGESSRIVGGVVEEVMDRSDAEKPSSLSS